MIFAPSQRSNKLEMLDTIDCKPEHLKLNLREIAKFNSVLKTRDAILSYVKLIIEINKLSGQIKILDLCAGSADIPVFIIDWARKNNIDVKITAIDIGEDIIRIAKEETVDYPEIESLAADAFNLPYSENSFNIVICSQAFHHFKDEDCIRLLKIMYQLCSNGIIVNDLRRAWINYLGAMTLTRLWNFSEMGLNDAPLSVLRAFTKEEFLELGKKAEIPNIKCHSFFTHSLQLVAYK
ncbi:MAG: methyltransferase domain-containing protein [Candidatus Sericytochromatia bacterium]|nr:methyltransferase domain-containing protein [Candidatus Sericytochromatia bacterium]